MLLAVWLVAVLILSVVPVSQPETGMPLDKVEHLLAYGIGSILVFRSVRPKLSLKRAAIISIAAASGYGAAIECIQYFLPHRSFSPADAAANTLGAFVFCIPYALWKK